MDKIYIKSLGITTTIILIYTAVMIIFVSPKIEQRTLDLEEEASKSKLSEIKTLLHSTSKELESFKQNSIDIHKQELKNIVLVAKKNIEKYYAESRPEMIRVDVKNKTEEFLSMLNSIYEAIKDQYSHEQIKDIFTQILKSYSYEDGSKFFWIDDYKDRMINHPVLTKAKNKNTQLQIKDRATRKSFVMMLDAALSGGKSIYHQWIDPKSGKLENKISYVSMFEPLEWLIGIGYFLEDVKDKKQKEALQYVEGLRYGDDEYLYVSDYNSKLIGHPKLKGKDFSNIKDKKGNLIVPPMVEIARKNKEGYHSYWWTRLNDTNIYEKLTYSYDFSEWKWIVGTGLYLVDVEEESKRKKEELVAKLKDIIYTTKVSKSGYIFIFDSKGEMIVHPNKKLENDSFASMKNPGKSTVLYNDLISAYKSGEKKMSYRWDKLNDKGNYKYQKVTWIDYDEKFDWYICSSAYLDDLMTTSKQLRSYILFISSMLFLVAFIISLYFFKKLLRPVEMLSRKAKVIKDGDFSVRSGIDGSDEIGILASTFDDMLDTIESHILNLDDLVKEKTSKVTSLLDNAGQGFLTFGSDLLVEKEYSKECETIFAQEISGQKITSLLFDQNDEENIKLFEKIIKDLLDEKIPQKRKRVFLNLAVKELVVNNKHINISYKILTDKIMLIISDITKQKELEKKVDDEKRVLKMIVSVVQNIPEFKEMVVEYKKFCDDLNRLLDQKKIASEIVVIYRKIHTFKGNFAQKDLIYIVPKLHRFENYLNDFVKNPDKNIGEISRVIKKENIYRWIFRDIKILQQALGKEFLNSKQLYDVDAKTIKNIQNKVEKLLKHDRADRDVTYEDILDDIKHLKDVKLIDLLSSYKKTTEQLAKRLHKEINQVNIIGDLDVKVPIIFKHFTKSLVHVFRNSVDHGVELVEERIKMEKDQKATITCLISKDTNGNLEISIVDDGKGIDVEAMKQKALQKGIYDQDKLDMMSQNEIYMIMFEDSFSTKDSVSEISGRGVGLAAVKAECEMLGGKIEIESKYLKGSTFKFIIPMKGLS
jgi:two-component system chemotaxis sensor kinase CheA